MYKFRPDLFQCVANAYADVGAFFFRFIVLLLFSCFENATVFPMGSQRFSDLLFSRFPRIQWPRKSQDVLCHGNNKSPKSETPKRNFFLFCLVLVSSSFVAKIRRIDVVHLKSKAGKIRIQQASSRKKQKLQQVILDGKLRQAGSKMDGRLEWRPAPAVVFLRWEVPPTPVSASVYVWGLLRFSSEAISSFGRQKNVGVRENKNFGALKCPASGLKNVEVEWLKGLIIVLHCFC